MRRSEQLQVDLLSDGTMLRRSTSPSLVSTSMSQISRGGYQPACILSEEMRPCSSSMKHVLKEVKEVLKTHEAVGFFTRDGLIYRQWILDAMTKRWQWSNWYCLGNIRQQLWS